MSTTAADLRLTSHDAAGVGLHRDLLLDVYAEIYADKLADPFFSTARYWERLEAYASRTGFALVVGFEGEEPVGYALGFTLPEGSGWWRGLQGDYDPELLVEDGARTFALTEIMVRETWRRRGYARRLHDTLLTGRQEERATLLVLPDNAPARAAYAAWGWSRLGGIKPFDDSPTYDAMVVELRTGHNNK